MAETLRNGSLQAREALPPSMRVANGMPLENLADIIGAWREAVERPATYRRRGGGVLPAVKAIKSYRINVIKYDFRQAAWKAEKLGETLKAGGRQAALKIIMLDRHCE